MNGAKEVIAHARELGLTLTIRDDGTNIGIRPAGRAPVELVEAIRACKVDLLAALRSDEDFLKRVEAPFPSSRIIEATFRDATGMGKPLPAVDYAEPHAVTPVSPEFPPCPKCGSCRYWISRGKVLCGSRTCYSAVRFVLTKIEYHRVH